MDNAFTAENDDSLEIPKESRVLRLQSYDKSVEDLVNMITEKKKITLENIEFQREYVWDDKIASLFIESIILNVPIPPIYVSEEQDGTWLVIDGLQRLTSLKRFYSADFKLKGLEVLKELESEDYDSLNYKAKDILNQGNIRVIVVTKESHPEIKFDVFMRLNRGSVKLTEQELRNCMYRGTLNTLLKEARLNSKFKTSMGIDFERFEDMELILRYFALSEAVEKTNMDIKGYGNSMKNFLNKFMQANRDADEEKIKSLKTKFEDNIEKVHIVFGSNAFRGIESNGEFSKRINKALFDMTMVCFEQIPMNVIELKKDKILELYKSRLNPSDGSNTRLLEACSIRATNKNAIETRFKEWSDSLSNVTDF